VDNDVVLKAACFGLAPRFWMHTDGNPAAGVLGSARFVLTHVVTHGPRVRNKDSANRALEDFFARAAVLEPTDAELCAAAEVEQLAQRAGLELDVGESQLAAIVASRRIPLLDTGDKRAVRGLEALLDHSQTCTRLRARVRCLEQLLLRVLDEAPDQFEAIADAVCAELEVDKTASICFGCYSGNTADRDNVRTGLQSYIAALRRQAPGVLTD
jgi:hypothetical protein